ELVRGAREHLAHGSQLFRLNELLFEAFDFRNVAARNNHALDLAGFVKKRAEVTANSAVVALLVAHAHFERTKSEVAGKNFVEEGAQSLAILGVGTITEFQIRRFVGLEAENLTDARTDEGVVCGSIQNEDQIGETIDQAARELLLLVETVFDFAPLGDIHERALVTDHRSGGVPDGNSSIEADDGG